MPNARERIRLTEAEQDEPLEGAQTLQIASILPDGRPDLVPLWFARDDGSLPIFPGAHTSGQPRPDVDPDPTADPPPIADKRVTVRIHPAGVRSWDHRKLG